MVLIEMKSVLTARNRLMKTIEKSTKSSSFEPLYVMEELVLFTFNGFPISLSIDKQNSIISIDYFHIIWPCMCISFCFFLSNHINIWFNLVRW